MKKAKSVDEYIKTAPKEARGMLRTIRKIVKSNAPKALEKLSYGIPYYSLNGRLLYFGYASKHVALYMMGGPIRAFKKDVKKYSTSAGGTIRFPFGKPLPIALIKKFVKFRVKANEKR